MEQKVGRLNGIREITSERIAKSSKSPKNSPRDRQFMKELLKSESSPKLIKKVSTPPKHEKVQEIGSKEGSPCLQMKSSGEVGINIYPMSKDDEDFWKDVLLNFNSEVAAGVIAYFVRKDIVEEEKEMNSLTICSYYSKHEKFPRILKIYPNNTNTIYSSLLSSLFGYFGKCLDDIEYEHSNTTMLKYKSTILDIVELLMNTKSIPNSIQFAYYTMYYLFTLKCSQLLMKTMLKYVFKVPFNSFITSLIKSMPEHFSVLMVISKLFNLLIDGTTSSVYWNQWLFANCQDLMDIMTDHIHKKKINNLRVNTFTETQTFLLRLAEMKLKIKDLKEERRYLKSLLNDEDLENSDPE
ncbi:Ras-GAP domain-containing protein [Entamoeba marina]